MEQYPHLMNKKGAKISKKILEQQLSEMDLTPESLSELYLQIKYAWTSQVVDPEEWPKFETLPAPVQRRYDEADTVQS